VAQTECHQILFTGAAGQCGGAGILSPAAGAHMMFLLADHQTGFGRKEQQSKPPNKTET